MDIAPHDRNSYFKLVALIVDIAYTVIQKFLKVKVLLSDSFETFLNKEKHKLVHMYETAHCCECNSGKIVGKRMISRKQLLMFYTLDDSKRTHNHIKRVRGKLSQTCICQYSAKPVNVQLVDITIANYIIQKCTKNKEGIEDFIEQIKDIRNDVFHLSDIQKITNEDFSSKWTTLEYSILKIAEIVDTPYAEEIEKRIKQIEKLTFIPDYLLKYEILCRDYWEQKYAEFEVK